MFTAQGTDWAQRANDLEVRTRLLIDGQWRDASDGAEVVGTSPVDGRALPAVAYATAGDVDDAVRSARHAFDAGIWSGLAPRVRGQRLIAFAELVRDNAEELAATITLEMGKPVRMALEVEMRAVVTCLQWYGEAIDKLLGEIPATAPDALALITREPAGVVGAIVPWNFPLTMTAWKIAPALAAGNSVVLKPAEQSTYSALRLAELALEAGIPAGVLNVIPGRGDVAGRALGEHPDVDVITFTGSPRVGRAFQRYAADSNGKRVWLELGGKTASIILPDADVEASVRATAQGCFFNQGEMCTASSRMLVHRSQLDEAVRIASAVAAEQAPGDPFDVDSPSGAIVSEQQLERITGFVQRAIADGSHLAAGTTEPARTLDGGTYFSPVVLSPVRPDQEVAKEEVFGPVLAIIPFDSLEEAIEIANGTEYGLATSLWTNDLGVAHRTARALKSGVVWVNCFEEGDMTMPFGGVKGSGYGRDKSLHAMEKFTDVKSTWIQL